MIPEMLKMPCMSLMAKSCAMKGKNLIQSLANTKSKFLRLNLLLKFVPRLLHLSSFQKMSL